MYVKVKKSSDINKAIDIEEKKIFKKIKKFSDKYGVNDKDGKMHKQLFIYISMLTTLKQIKENDPLVNDVNDVVDPSVLYEKLIRIKNNK